eukprot:GDKK01054357.1.p1 GENE.GDKK01054357.1~~GDKK01054357.1.p1  ORF type:complete len:229 (+),score=48.45 GDKK01054357.1:33-719(+)
MAVKSKCLVLPWFSVAFAAIALALCIAALAVDLLATATIDLNADAVLTSSIWGDYTSIVDPSAVGAQSILMDIKFKMSKVDEAYKCGGAFEFCSYGDYATPTFALTIISVIAFAFNLVSSVLSGLSMSFAPKMNIYASILAFCTSVIATALGFASYSDISTYFSLQLVFSDASTSSIGDSVILILISAAFSVIQMIFACCIKRRARKAAQVSNEEAKAAEAPAEIQTV